MDKLSYASSVAFNTCIGVKKGERVLVLYDRTTKTIVDSFVSILKKIGATFMGIDVDEFRPIREFPERIKKALLDCDVCLFMIDTVANELENFRRPLRLIALDRKIRYLHMPKITDEIFIDSVGVDYHKIWEITAKVRSIVEKAKEIRVVSDVGTDLVASFSDKISWVSSDGDFRVFSKEKMNLPGAEVFTCPDKIDGRIVIDGLLSSTFTKKYGDLRDNPVVVDIKDSRAAGVKCKNPKLANEFIDAIKTDENSDRVGEFAFGTNIFLQRYYNNFLVDEKYPGFHIAFGNPYPERTGADWVSKLHLDCLIKKASAIIDKKEKILINGKYMF